MRRVLPVLGFCSASFSLLLTGCTLRPSSSLTQSQATALSGQVRGGQQPVSGAAIQLYAASSLGDGTPAIPLLTQPVTTDSSGGFTITNDYTCPSSNSLVYLTATRGNPGLPAGSTNSALAMMAALGTCGSLSPSTNILVNELTTVGSAAALYPFMASPSALGSSVMDQSQLAAAFQLVPQYTDIASGLVPGPALPSGSYASSTELRTLADILATCINSAGGQAADGSPCGSLFNLTRSVNNVAPTDTISAILNILNRPTNNIAALYALSPGSGAPFQPTLTAPPSDWTLPILPIPASPVISPASGPYAGTQYVTITESTPGAAVFYTLDGSTPTTASSRYTLGSTTISLNVSASVRAFASIGGRVSSPVVSSSFTINPAPSSLAVVAGSGQSARVGTAFAVPLQVRVLDQNNLPFPGAAVSFAVSATGAGANLSTSCTTNANGLCSVQAVANQTPGTFSANASLGLLTAGFTLTNTGLHSYLVAVSTDNTTGVASNCIDQASASQAANAACSLRDALAAAAASATSASSATVTFSQTAPATITLAQGTLAMPAYTTLQGATSGSGKSLTNLITLDGTSAGTILMQSSGVLQSAINNLIFTNGNAAGLGGAISMGSGSLSIANSTFSQNQAANSGGAITNAGGTLTIFGSTFLNNTAVNNYGGAIDNYSNGTIQISNSTFVGNYAGSDGGAIYTNGTANITNTTITGNNAPYGAAIYNKNTNPLVVTNSILTADGNEECGGIYCAPLWVYINFAAATTQPVDTNYIGLSFTDSQGNVFGQSVQYGQFSSPASVASAFGPYFYYNYSGIDTTPITGQSFGSLLILTPENGATLNPIVVTNPGKSFTATQVDYPNPVLVAAANNVVGVTAAQANLSALGFNGGPTQTVVPLAGSIALCRITPASAAGTDQRGQPRSVIVNGTTCQDAGAVQTAQ